uniref:Uncharacterized protein n=1 Tax=Tanacetum cinerariifolium TaxID=118510 RepID=A0A699H0U6_TANCI|nr:hypothetical protein [Tanacetum cinerariifolium]
MLSGYLDLLEDNQPSGVWHVKETDEAICILRNMSGKKDVTVTVDKEPSYLNFRRWNSFGIVSHNSAIQSFPAVLVFKSLTEVREAIISVDLPRERYVTDGIIEIKMDNKLSKVIIPKVKVDMVPRFTCSIHVKGK